MNNRHQIEPKRRYAIRKMSVCVGSVLIGFFFLAGATTTVQATELGTEASALLATTEPQAEDISTKTADATQDKPVVDSPKTTATTTEELKQTILDVPAHNYYEDPQFELSQTEVTVKAGESVKLSLNAIDSKEAAEQVNWYIRTRYPEDAVFGAGESVKGPEGSDLLSLSQDGTVTSLSKESRTQTVELWAHHNQHLHRALVTLPGTARMEAIRQDDEANRKAEQIIKPFEHLSDVEKAKAAHDWIIENVKYVERFGQDQTAYSALVELAAVCGGYANAYKLLMDKLGIPSRTKMGYIPMRPHDELHLWNLVELDGEWYHVDPTWDYPGTSTAPDSTDRGYNHRNKYFLIHDEDFSKASGSKRRYHISGEKMGQRYRYYGFEQKGILAKTLDEVSTIFERQFNKIPSKNTTAEVEVMTPADMSLHQISNRLVAILGKDRLNATHSANYGGYTLHRFQLKLYPSWSTRDVDPVFNATVRADETVPNTKVSSLLVNLDKASDLNTANFTVTGAKLTKADKLSDTSYRLVLDEPKMMTNATVEVAINKRRHQFNMTDKTVSIQVNRAAKPEAVFTATGEHQGRLSNVTTGMEYRIGSGSWTAVTGDHVELTGIGTADIYIRVPKTEQAFGSAVQHIAVKKAKDPVAKAFNGNIIGVNKDTDYRRQGEQVWQSSTGNILTGLTSGVYEIRTREKGDHLASNVMTVTVETTPDVLQPTNDNGNVPQKNPQPVPDTGQTAAEVTPETETVSTPAEQESTKTVLDKTETDQTLPQDTPVQNAPEQTTKTDPVQSNDTSLQPADKTTPAEETPQTYPSKGSVAEENKTKSSDTSIVVPKQEQPQPQSTGVTNPTPVEDSEKTVETTTSPAEKTPQTPTTATTVTPAEETPQTYPSKGSVTEENKTKSSDTSIVVPKQEQPQPQSTGVTNTIPAEDSEKTVETTTSPAEKAPQTQTTATTVTPAEKTDNPAVTNTTQELPKVGIEQLTLLVNNPHGQDSQTILESEQRVETRNVTPQPLTSMARPQEQQVAAPVPSSRQTEATTAQSAQTMTTTAAPQPTKNSSNKEKAKPSTAVAKPATPATEKDSKSNLGLALGIGLPGLALLVLAYLKKRKENN